MCVLLVCCFFCFKQETAYEMRISDWSSDVCSSDLTYGGLDILYNNVGGSTPRDNLITEMPMEEFWHAINRDLLTTFLATRFGLRAMQKLGRGGSVINTSKSEERRVGKECVSTCRLRWFSYH